MTHDWEWLKYVEIPAIYGEIGDGLLLFYPHYIYSDWLVVSTPLKNMSSPVGMKIFPI